MDEIDKNLIAQAKLGLEALIDEATGYQEVRLPDELRKRYAELGGDEADYTAPDALPEEGGEWMGEHACEVCELAAELAEERIQTDRYREALRKICEGFTDEELDAADPLWRVHGPAAAMVNEASLALGEARSLLARSARDNEEES